MTRNITSQVSKVSTKEVPLGRRCWPYSVLLAHQDETGKVFYRPKPMPDKPAKIADEELLQLSDLVLDLDDERNKDVRPATPCDEAHLAKKWGAMLNYQKARSQVNELKKEIAWSRLRLEKLGTVSGLAWLITNHDLASVVLRGSPVKGSDTPFEDRADAYKGVQEERVPGAGPTAASVDVQGGSDAVLQESMASPTAWEHLDPRKKPDFMKEVLWENGISDNAITNDASVLDWLSLRRHQQAYSVSSYAGSNKPIPTVEIAMALRRQTSISSIRRLIFQAFARGLDPSALCTVPERDSQNELIAPDLSFEIRQACTRAIATNPSSTRSGFEVLSFLGNLRARLSALNLFFSPSLWGLGLIMSAEANLPKITLDYLHLGLMRNVGDRYPDMLDDIVCSLAAYEHQLSSSSAKEPLPTQDRQMLLQTLVGANSDAGQQGMSIRSYVLAGLNSGHPEACRAYGYYIMLLGRLGAIRTIWKEWHSTAYMVQEMMNDGLAHEDQHFNIIEAFLPACTASLGMVGPDITAGDRDVSGLMDCAMLDHQDIESHGPQLPESVSVQDESDYGIVAQALNKSLLHWLDAVGAFRKAYSRENGV